MLILWIHSYYHKQFKHAAKKRYFVNDLDYLYFHSYMGDYFLGTYGGGILKPFRYTEIQKHMFKLKFKDDSKDRQVPAMPLAHFNKYSLRWNWVLKGLRQIEIKCKNADVIQKARQADKIQPEKIHRAPFSSELTDTRAIILIQIFPS